jgi:nucleotide-binding universal stress UspA family protein
MDILVAVDGSAEAEDALDYAATIAAATDGSLTIAHAVDPAVYQKGGTEPVSGFSDADRRLLVENVEDAEERGMDILDDAAERARDRGHDPATELLYGDPAVAVPDYADAEGIDTIVVGHRGRSERAGLLLGSVAKDLVERSSLPVTVVR